jgi:hypothetical protein
MTEHSDSRVLVQFIDDDLLDHLSGDCIALTISCAFSDDDDVQTLARRAFLHADEMIES